MSSASRPARSPSAPSNSSHWSIRTTAKRCARASRRPSRPVNTARTPTASSLREGHGSYASTARWRGATAASLFAFSAARRTSRRLGGRAGGSESESRSSARPHRRADAAALLAEDGEFVLVNHVWRQLSGYGPEEFSDLAGARLTHGEQAEQVMAQVRHASDPSSTRTRASTNSARKMDGRWCGSTQRCGPPSRGRQILVVMAMDVTERQQAMARLADSERRFRIVAQSTNDACGSWTSARAISGGATASSTPLASSGWKAPSTWISGAAISIRRTGTGGGFAARRH